MLNNEAIQVLLEQIQVLLIFLERPVVQQQVMVMVLLIVAAWLLSDGLWRFVKPRARAWGDVHLQKHRQHRWANAMLLLEFISFPLLAVTMLLAAIQMFQVRSLLAESMVKALPILGFVLGYRFLLAILYMGIGGKYVKYYHHRLLNPLFVLALFLWLTRNVINLSNLLNIQLFQSFNGPVTLGAMLLAVLGLYFLFNLAWAVQDTIEQAVAPHTNVEPGAINAVLTIGRYAVFGIGILIVLATLGVDATTLAVIGGGLSVGVGLGLQSIVSNFISGIVLLFEQSLRPGDVVKIDNTLGEVKKLSIRATTVRTFDNVDITVPNETLFTTSVTNYTQSSRVVRVLLNVGVSYNSDPKQVIDVLLDAAHEHGLVLDDPEPRVFFNDFGNSSLDFVMALWVEDPNYLWRVPSDLRQMIWKRFKEHGIEIPFPQRDLHIRSGSLWPAGGPPPTPPEAEPPAPDGS